MSRSSNTTTTTDNEEPTYDRATVQQVIDSIIQDGASDDSSESQPDDSAKNEPSQSTTAVESTDKDVPSPAPIQKKKRKMTPTQLENLRKGREKAIQSRRDTMRAKKKEEMTKLAVEAAKQVLAERKAAKKQRLQSKPSTGKIVENVEKKEKKEKRKKMVDIEASVEEEGSEEGEVVVVKKKKVARRAKVVPPAPKKRKTSTTMKRHYYEQEERDEEGYHAHLLRPAF